LLHKFISIRTKLIFSLSIAILAFVGISLCTSYSYVIRTSRESLIQKGGLLLRIAKNEIDGMALVNDLASINNFITRMKHDDPDILYIVVVDKHKNIIGHTFDANAIPGYLAGFYRVVPQRLLIDKRRGLFIREMSAPLMSGYIGSVIIGLNEKAAAQRGHQLVVLMLVVFAALLLPTGAVAFSLSYLITHPIHQVMKSLERFTLGFPLPEVNILFNDEMKLLAARLRNMTERINFMDKESKQTQLKIIETEKMASIGVLASGVAHEINNPIAGIEICALRLQKGKDLNVGHREYARMIVEAAGHVKSVVKGLLAYARQPDLKEEQVELRSAIDFSLKLLQYRLQKNGVETTVTAPDHECFVAGIRVQIIQVMINGIINAIDAVAGPGKIFILLSETRDSFHLTVADSGPGVTPSILGKVFDPFFTTKGNKGTGLGLYVSYNIVHAHGGTIELTSPESGGARLTIVLPKARIGAVSPRISALVSAGLGPASDFERKVSAKA
jgi:two-component system NtrC family sensor kinase